MASRRKPVGNRPASAPMTQLYPELNGNVQVAQAESATIFDEIGMSGLVITGGRGGQGYVYDELHPLLRGRRGMRIYREMHDNNSVTGQAFQAMEMILCRIAWEARQAKDGGKAAQEECDYLQQVHDDMDHTWTEFMGDSLTTYPYGFSIFEKVMKLRNGMAPGFDPSGRPLSSSKFDDGRIGIRGLHIRPQETMEYFIFDDHGWPLVFVQRTMQGLKPIPMVKCLHLRTKNNRNNPEGRSIYRNGFRSWHYLKRFEEDEAVGFNKALQGMMIGRMPKEYFDSTLLKKDTGKQSTVNAIRETMAGVHRNEYEYLLFPAKEDKDGTTGFDVTQFEVGDGRFAAMNTAIERKQREIATLVFFTQFFSLGQGGASGNRALSEDQTDFFELALNGVLKNVRDTYQRQVIDPLYELNGVDAEIRAMWEPGEVSKEDIKQLSEVWKNFTDSGVLNATDDDEDFVRKKLRAPVRTVSREDLEPDVSAVPSPPAQPPAPPSAPTGAPSGPKKPKTDDGGDGKKPPKQQKPPKQGAGDGQPKSGGGSKN